MESQEEEYKRSVWGIYRKEWATASPEKRTELNKRMLRWQELMKSGLTAQQAYYKAMEGELDFKGLGKPSGKQLAIPSTPRICKASLVLLSLALVAAIVYSVIITKDRDALNTELKSVQSVLASTQVELDSTKNTLEATKQTLVSALTESVLQKQTLILTQSELNSTKQTLTSTQAELTSTQSEITSTNLRLASTKSELDATNQTLSSVQQASTKLQDTLSATQQQLDVAQETLGGFVKNREL